MSTEIATFAAGCFWGVEHAFRQVPGVVGAAAGYTGGRTKGATYEDVCRGDTGHAEAVRVEYDGARVSYEKLVDEFFAMHDATTLNRQGPDVGDQYRSAIFYHTPEQERAARAAVERLSAAKRFAGPIVTQIARAGEFYRAEDYHQQYFQKNPERAACHVRRA